MTVRPRITDDAILTNPDMGLVFFHYSNRQWAYGQRQERGDVLDWFPGVTTAYFRLPWCLLEPREGEYRWDLIDSYVLVYMHERNPAALVAGDRIPTIEPGRYTLCASLGDPDGTPRLALPLSGGIARRYPVGSIQIA